MTDTESIVLEALHAAAANGEPCPTNVELANIIGCKSISTAAKAVQSLEVRGRIIVQRFVHARVVTIVGAGVATATTPDGMKYFRTIGPRHEPRIDPTRQAIRRDACSFCGVRAEIGCNCRPRAQGLTVLRGRLPQEIPA